MVAEDVLDERGVDVREPAAAELLRPGHPDPAGLAERERDLVRVAVREHALAPPLGIRLEARPETRGERGRFLAERDLRVGQPEIHAAAIVEAP